MWGAALWHYRMFSSVPSLDPLDANNTLYLAPCQVMTAKNVSKYYQMSPGHRITPVENHCSKMQQTPWKALNDFSFSRKMSWGRKLSWLLHPREEIKGNDVHRKATWTQSFLCKEPLKRQVLENFGLQWRESGTISFLVPYKYIWWKWVCIHWCVFTVLIGQMKLNDALNNV